LTHQLNSETSFKALGLRQELVRTLSEKGYSLPTPIQAAVIPAFLEGQDVLGQARTGTGKTAAFALPALHRLAPTQRSPQILVLTPTRELALQVAQACVEYSRLLPDVRVLAIYGGASMGDQRRELKRGAQVIVGTPGRVADFVRRGVLDLSGIRTVVLDEADEMLRMGFIEEIEWILQQLPTERQTALFSATMAPEIRRIARNHLHDHHEVKIKDKAEDTPTISQHYWLVSGTHKLDALDRILEFHDVEAAIIFVRTKSAAVEVADALQERGYAAAALNGDMTQNVREQVVESLRAGRIKILVATDVAARGLDVEQITHVFNYDLPHDTEAYVHRIGRTGRAGRRGVAIVFISPQKRKFLQKLEAKTGSRITEFSLPTRNELVKAREQRFQKLLDETLQGPKIPSLLEKIDSLVASSGKPVEHVAAALYELLQQRLNRGKRSPANPERSEGSSAGDHRVGQERTRAPRGDYRREAETRTSPKVRDNTAMEVYRLDNGRDDDIEVSGIVAALAQATGLTGRTIGKITLFAHHTTVEMPVGLDKGVVQSLKSLWINNRKVSIEKLRSRDGVKQAFERPRRQSNFPAKRREKRDGRENRRRGRS
jgi:ATP-dependent RNA helicase DeaD